MRLFKLHFLLVFLLVSVANAQQHTLYSSKIGIEDGLSNYNINDIIQDQRGIIWASTDYGLNRYDGIKVQIYTREENGLFGNVIKSMGQDYRHNIWMASIHNNRQDITIFDPITERNYSIQEYTNQPPPFDPNFTFFYSSKKSKSVLFKEFNQDAQQYYFFEYDGKTFSRLFEEFKLDGFEEHIFFYCTKLAPNKYCLFTVNGGEILEEIFILNKRGKILESTKLKGNFKMSIFGETKNAFYITTLDQNTSKLKLFLHDGNKASWIEKPLSLAENEYQIFYHSEKQYVISKDSLFIISPTQQLRFKLASQLNNINSIYVDKDENIWLSDEAHLHLLQARPQPIKTELSTFSPNQKLRGITLDAKGRLYAGNIGYLVCKDSIASWINIMDVYKASFHNYLGMHADQNGVWMGLQEGRLLYYDINTLKAETFGENTAKAQVMLWQPYRAKDGNVWVGSNQGLYHLDLESRNLIAFKDTSQQLHKSLIYAFHENEKGTWLSTSNGLYLVDLSNEKILGHYNDYKKGKYFIPTNHIAHLHEDSSGNFWLATKGNGLIQWNPKTGSYKQYTQKGAGLSSNMLYSVYGDNFDNLWMSSARGLICFNNKNGYVRIFLKEDGLSHNEFNTISHFQGADGHLYFGGQNGMIHFHPKDMQTNVQQSSLVLTDATIQKKYTDTLINKTAAFIQDSLIQFMPSDKSVTLHFALLDYTNTQNHQYSYKLEGYDKKWSYQNSNIINLQNLPYGKYNLKVRAKAANSSVWTYYPNTFILKVIAPFYKQTSFLILLGILFFIIILLVFRWRVQRIERRRKELETIVAERTEELRRDKALIEVQAEELKTLDHLKSNFFANISHELRTPLTLILGPLSYLLDQEEAWDIKEVRQQLMTMHRNGKSLMTLIEEILDLTKLEAKKLELKEEATPAKLFIEQILEHYYAKLSSLKLRIEFQFQFDQDIYLLLDRKKIEQVFNNFLSNAIKYSAPSSKITLSVYREDQYFCIKVSDQGRGIHPDDLPHIFERYYQAKHKSAKLEGGTGIGLALVRELATLMQGKTYATSVIDEGSHFYFKTPYKATQKQEILLPNKLEELEGELIESIGSNFNILVVEDNLDMQKFVVHLLSKRYAKVFCASNGKEGLAVLEKKQEPIHLIVSDVMMPEMDGFTMAEKLKNHPKFNNIPIIMLTALAAERNKLKALTIGVDDYLNKPFSSTELLVRTQNLLYNYHQRRLAAQEIEESLVKEEEVETAQQKSEEKLISVSNKKWIEELEQYVKKHLLDSNLSVDDLAAACFISKRQLSRKLKTIIGVSPAKFIKEIQLSEARKQLERGSASTITEIAYNCGFQSIQSFSRSYKNRFGKAPSEYLKK